MVNAGLMLRETSTTGMHAAAGHAPPEWVVEPGLTSYADAVAEMEARVAAIAEGGTPERIWLVEHPPLYTAGTSAKAADLLHSRFPVFESGRGGQYTYHGPGQRVAYAMLNLEHRGKDLRRFVAALEAWLIGALGHFNVTAERRQDRVGVWVRRPEKPRGIDGSMAEDKIAAIGIRVRRWVTFHGVSLNVEPELSHFTGIVPCGVAEQHFGVTSLADLGLTATLEDADIALREAFAPVFGETVLVPASRMETGG
ncbi:MAG: lipoyl(octanoyl) transferase LipB [Beijerinckiaceae bacterium]